MFPPSADPEVSEPLAASPEMEAFRKFALLTARKKQLNALLKEIEPQLKALEPILLGYFGENGYEMVKIEGFTMSPKREPWIYPIAGLTRQTVCEALKICGLGRFVKENYSTRSITAYVRELEEHHQLTAGADPDALRELLPETLSKVLEVRPGFKVQVLDRRKGVQNASFEEDFNTEEGEYDAE